MRTLLLAIAVACVFISASHAQDQKQAPQPQSKQYQGPITENVKIADRVVLSSESTTVRIASLNETVAMEGRVMRVSDLMAVLSSDNLLAPHPRTQESQTPAESRPVPPQSQKH
jgi:hypothetical protein